jgi:hypothetical protein
MFKRAFGRKVRKVRKLFVILPVDLVKQKILEKKINKKKKLYLLKKYYFNKYYKPWKKIFSRTFIKSRKNIFFFKRVPSFISKNFYKKIFKYKYKLYLYLKYNLQARLQIFLKYNKNFLYPLFDSLFRSLKNRINKVVIKKEKIFKGFSFLFTYYKDINDVFSKKNDFFLYKQILFYKNFYNRKFFIYFLLKFFKQLSFLRFFTTFSKKKRKRVFSFVKEVDYDTLIYLIKRFKYERIYYF